RYRLATVKEPLDKSLCSAAPSSKRRAGLSLKLSRRGLSALQFDGGATVTGTGRGGLVIRHRITVAMIAHGNHFLVDPGFDQILGHGFGTLLGELTVGNSMAIAVTVPVNDHAGNRGVGADIKHHQVQPLASGLG